MAFKDYYQNLPDPKAEIKKKIMERCDIAEATFYKWMSGETQNISKLAKEAISEITGIPADELFPQTELSEKA